MNVHYASLGLLAALSFATPAIADPLTADRSREILRDALGAFDEAVESVHTDAPAATVRFRASAAGFERLIEAGFDNAALHYNLANARFQLGDLGRAVLHYRRAQRLDPADVQIAANLRYARDRVEPFVQPSGKTRLTERLLFWNRATSMPRRLTLTAAGSLVGWLLLTFWLRKRTSTLAVLGIAGVLVGVANAAALAWELHDQSARPPAVVIDGEYTLRLGRGEGADPAMSVPLGPGVELQVIGERGGWVEARLVNDQTGWLPEEAIARVVEKKRK